MNRQVLRLLVSLPWVAALVVLLAVVKLADQRSKVHWGAAGQRPDLLQHRLLSSHQLGFTQPALS